MDFAYWTAMRIGLAIGGPFALIASFYFMFAILISGRINRLIGIFGVITLLPVAITFAYYFGGILVPEFPNLGFFCSLGYGMLMNWALCFVSHYAGDIGFNKWKKHLQASSVQLLPNNPTTINSVPDAPQIIPEGINRLKRGAMNG